MLLFGIRRVSEDISKSSSMRTTLTKAFLFGLLGCAGCDQVLTVPTGPGGGNFLPWLQTMNNVRVTYTGATNVHTFLKQGSLDGGNTSDVWLTRDLEFENRDSNYTLVWQDSQFSTKSCIVFRQKDPFYIFSSDCGDQSLIRGMYHSGANSISNLLCMFQNYHGGTDPNNYQEQGASIVVPSLELDSFGDDSVSFSVKNWKDGSISLAYNYDERAYGTYIKQRQLTAYDTLGTQYPQVCRLVFYKK